MDPIYPEDARRDHISGAVVLAATVDDEGKVLKLSSVSGPEKLRDAALNAANQWTFKPYLLNGRPVFVSTQFAVGLQRRELTLIFLFCFDEGLGFLEEGEVFFVVRGVAAFDHDPLFHGSFAHGELGYVFSLQ